MTPEQQQDINELTGFIREMEAFKTVGIEKYWKGPTDFNREVAHRITMGVTTHAIPKSIMGFDYDDKRREEQYQGFKPMKEAIELFADSLIKKAKAKIIEICNAS